MTGPGIHPPIGVAFRLRRNQMLRLGILQVGRSESFASNFGGVVLPLSSTFRLIPILVTEAWNCVCYSSVVSPFPEQRALRSALFLSCKDHISCSLFLGYSSTKVEETEQRMFLDPVERVAIGDVTCHAGRGQRSPENNTIAFIGGVVGERSSFKDTKE